jgi:hypothetical protein
MDEESLKIRDYFVGAGIDERILLEWTLESRI